VYYWYPKATGRQLNEKLGKVHFWLSFVAITSSHADVLPGHGRAVRRLYDPTVYAHGRGLQALNVLISWGAWAWARAALLHRELSSSA